MQHYASLGKRNSIPPENPEMGILTQQVNDKSLEKNNL